MASHGQRCYESAHKVADAAQEGDIVIFLWSPSNPPYRPPNLLFDTGKMDNMINEFANMDKIPKRLSPVEFHSRRLMRPESEDQILLVLSPAHSGILTPLHVIKQSLANIQNKLDTKAVQLTAHIWVQPINKGDRNDGVPPEWDEFKKVCEGVVEIDEVTVFLLWCNDPYSGYHENRFEEIEGRTRRGLARDIENGLMLSCLSTARSDEWWAIEGVIEWDRKRRFEAVSPATRVEWERKRIEEGKHRILDEALRFQKAHKEGQRQFYERYLHPREEWIQGEVDNLMAQLSRSQSGKQLGAEIQTYYAKFKEDAVPLQTIIDTKDMIPKKKREAKDDLKKKYSVFRSTVRDYFDEIKKLGIPIGEHLSDLYGYEKGKPLPPPKKKSAIKRWVLSTTL